MLDYPVHLKEGDELINQQARQPQQVEVGYFLPLPRTKSEEQPMLVTSYGAEEGEIKDKVVPHFNRYKEACASVGIILKIGITPLYLCFSSFS